LTKIGITGCTGVLGNLLKKKLSKKNINYSCFKGDIKKISDINRWIDKNKNLQKIIHFAALVPIDKVEKNKKKAIKTNFIGTKNLIKCIKEKKLKIWFFFPSTCHVYKSKKTKIKESDKIQPISFYGKTKLLTENFLNKNKNSNIKICIGRIFSFYHSTQKKPFLYPVIKERIKKYRKGDIFYLKGGESIRDISNAQDIVNIIYMITKLDLTGTFNIGTGKGMKIKKFVKKIAKKELKIRTFEKKDYLIANVNKLKNFKIIKNYINSL
tara:strand:+ start:436 stop:1239 length:804 start_codon:yes stop_codon:yes gene_type:complete